jgi:hypothetical protein
MAITFQLHQSPAGRHPTVFQAYKNNAPEGKHRNSRGGRGVNF